MLAYEYRIEVTGTQANKVDSGQIQIKCVDTKNQIADIFTNALPRIDFEQIRVMLLGW
jgi:hypothetical protein